MNTRVTTTPNVAPTTLHPPSTPHSITCPGGVTTPWDPGALCPSMAPVHTSTSLLPPRTHTHSPPRRPTPAPPSMDRRAASAPRTSCWPSARATPCPACPRTSSTSTTKPWWAPAGAPRPRCSAGEFRAGRWETISYDKLDRQRGREMRSEKMEMKRDRNEMWSKRDGGREAKRISLS